MAGHFSETQWRKIIAKLENDPAAFGMPEGGREASLIFASFNIRKFGKIKDSIPPKNAKIKDRRIEIEFFARFAARCDLIAIQEVQDDLEGLHLLKERMESRIAGDNEFGLVVSDIAGAVPGQEGMAERHAFIYRRRRVRRLDMASDINIDRSTVMAHFFDNHTLIVKTRIEYDKKVKEYEIKKLTNKRAKKPVYAVPAFITFMRSPHVAAFEIPAANGKDPITFAAVNTHLIYGTQKERDAEFEALVDWLANRLKDEKRMTVDNFILLGDLNLNFDKPRKDRERIESRVKKLNEEVFGSQSERRIYFPFIDVHPKTGKIFRTNARHNQTFDQIAFFLGVKEKNLPNDTWRDRVKDNNPDGFDCGVFNFANLFSVVLKGKPYLQLSVKEKKAVGKKFEYSVSDHMPIWVRIPRPGFEAT